MQIWSTDVDQNNLIKRCLLREAGLLRQLGKGVQDTELQQLMLPVSGDIQLDRGHKGFGGGGDILVGTGSLWTTRTSHVL